MPNTEIMKMLKYALLILICLTVSPTFAANDDCFPAKSNRLVTDYVGTLTPDQQLTLEQKLVNFTNTSSTQIAIVIVSDLCGYDKADFTYTLAEKWGVGQKGKNNGILIMVKPTGGQGERETFIATGYGLEGAIPDATARRIVEQEMIPHFKSNDIYGGLVAASDVIIKLTEGEFTADQYNSSNNAGGYFGLIFILFFLLVLFLGKFSSARTYSRRNNVGLWTALMLMSATSGSRSGSYGGFSSGSGSFGGGGGGFSGFGGGSFGGGGAGGSW